MSRYPSPGNRWIRVKRKFGMRCCHCHLVHDVEFRLDGDAGLEMRAVPNMRETKRERRKGAPLIWWKNNGPG